MESNNFFQIFYKKFEEKEAKSARKTFSFGATKISQNEVNDVNVAPQQFDSSATEINNNIDNSANNIVENV